MHTYVYQQADKFDLTHTMTDQSLA